MKTMTSHTPLTTPSDRWLRDWEHLITCATPAFETTTTDPRTIYQLLDTGCKRLSTPLVTWDIASGYQVAGAFTTQKEFIDAIRKSAETLKLDQAELNDPLNVLRLIPAIQVTNFSVKTGLNSAVFCLTNFYSFFENIEVRQEFENMIVRYDLVSGTKFRHIHFVQAPAAVQNFQWLNSVRHHIKQMPLGLPNAAEIRQGPMAKLLETYHEEHPANDAETHDESEAHLMAVASALVGLDRPTAEAVLYETVAKKGGLNPNPSSYYDEILPPIATLAADAAAKTLAATGTMEIVAAEEIIDPEDIAGVDRAIKRIQRAAAKFTPQAQKQQLDMARGLWLCGLEGSGKTTCAYAASTIFERITGEHWKVIRVKMPAFYGSLVGETERNWFDFEDRIKAIGKCICILDEVDKVFGGVSERNGDSGVSKSLFGLWLDWMSSKVKRAGVYPILCMNDPTGIPSEALRAGRLDAGFYFAMPNRRVREAIGRIHFAKRLRRLNLGLDAMGWTAANWKQFGDMTEHYLPGEIETLVCEARDLAADTHELALPSFEQVRTLIEERAQDIERNATARDNFQLRLDNMKKLIEACQAKGARPVTDDDDAALAPIQIPESAGRRGRVRPNPPTSLN